MRSLIDIRALGTRTLHRPKTHKQRGNRADAAEDAQTWGEMMTFRRYLQVISCLKNGFGSPLVPTICIDAGSVANPGMKWSSGSAPSKTLT